MSKILAIGLLLIFAVLVSQQKMPSVPVQSTPPPSEPKQTNEEWCREMLWQRFIQSGKTKPEILAAVAGYPDFEKTIAVELCSERGAKGAHDFLRGICKLVGDRPPNQAFRLYCIKLGE
jgi:hypothetical protein